MRFVPREQFACRRWAAEERRTLHNGRTNGSAAQAFAALRWSCVDARLRPPVSRAWPRQLPALLRRPGPVDDRHLDAAGGHGMARLSADGLRVAPGRRGVLR